jgi:hypothetical protein
MIRVDVAQIGTARKSMVVDTDLVAFGSASNHKKLSSDNKATTAVAYPHNRVNV